MGQTALDRRVEYTGEDSVPQGSRGGGPALLCLGGK